MNKRKYKKKRLYTMLIEGKEYYIKPSILRKIENPEEIFIRADCFQRS